MSPNETPETAPDTTADEAPQIIGLRGEPIKLPTGRWRAKVGQDGALERLDGYMVKAPE